jgi:hypothetical protein
MAFVAQNGQCQPGAAPWVQSDDEVRPVWAKALLSGNNAFAHYHNVNFCYFCGTLKHPFFRKKSMSGRKMFLLLLVSVRRVFLFTVFCFSQLAWLSCIPVHRSLLPHSVRNLKHYSGRSLFKSSAPE